MDCPFCRKILSNNNIRSKLVMGVLEIVLYWNQNWNFQSYLESFVLKSVGVVLFSFVLFGLVLFCFVCNLGPEAVRAICTA